MSETEAKGADIFSEEGRVVVSIISMGREDDQICMVGRLMGAWDAKMYMPPEMVVRTIKIMLNPSFLGYVLALPWILMKKKKAKAEE